MRLKKEHFQAGYYYHVYNHASRDTDLFKDKQDYSVAFNLLCQYLQPSQFAVVAYCLMPNHYHILIQQKQECSLFLMMNKVWFRYSKYFNKRYDDRGSIFAGKAQHKLVDRDDYLRILTAYIHMNPVAAGFTQKPEDWEWSNCQEWLGSRHRALYDREIINLHFSSISDYPAILDTISREKKIGPYLID